MSAETVNAASMAFKKALIKRALGTEKPGELSNHRNGVSSKTVLTEDGLLLIDIPRDPER